MPNLKSVPSELPEPPYPKNTKSGSLSFDVEVDRMLASDTWVIVDPEARPWCLLSWVISWNLVPCGSFPNDDAVIAARLGCSRNFFDVHRSQIMRGWVLHADNRLYHPVITEKVLQFLDMRKDWKNKKKSQRSPQSVPGDTPESPQSVPRVSRPSSSSSSSSSSSNPLSTSSGTLESSSSFMSRGEKNSDGEARKIGKPETAAKRVERATLPSWEDVKTVIERVNARSGRNHKLKNARGKYTGDAELIRQRLADWSLEDALRVVDGRADLWIGNEKMEQYFRIGTIFAKRNFEQYRSASEKSAYVYGSFLDESQGATINGECRRI